MILDGIRVLDFTTVVSGPLCTQLLGDLGADVIKVETPIGDISRHAAGPRQNGVTGFFSQFNRNKRSVVLDLKSQAGRDLVGRLAAECDVIVENFRPGVGPRIGLDYEVLREQHPRLIYVAISGFGPTGPYADLPAYDHVVQGLSGMMPVQGAGGSPAMIRSVVADKTAGLTAYSATLAALLHRERGGGGQRVDVPMLDAYVAFMQPELMASYAFPDAQGPPPPDVFQSLATRDGQVVGFAVQDAHFAGVCDAFECPQLASDPRFPDMVQRIAHIEDLYGALSQETLRYSTAEVVARARERGLPFAPVQTFEELMEDAQVQHSALVYRAAGTGEDGVSRDFRFLRHPARYDRSPATLRGMPPVLGEHTDEVLGLVGCGASEIAALREAGAVA